MFKVAIVEDDHMVSMLNRSFTSRDKRFQVMKDFSSGKTALPWLLANPVDLVIMDVYMPVLTGPELLWQLRGAGSGVDVIVVTAAHDTQTLGDLLKMGVVDYLVKPFTAQRFQQALDTFCQKRLALEGQTRVSQAEIDWILSGPAAAKPPLPKGLQDKTMELIRRELYELEEGTCEAIAARAGLSMVTTRRYLNYLLDNWEAESKTRYDTGGRPCAVYRMVGRVETFGLDHQEQNKDLI